MAVYEVFVDQFLALLQNRSENNPRGVFAYDVLELTDSAKNYKQFVSAADSLNLAQLVEVRKSIINVSVSDYLDLHHGGAKALDLQAVVQYLIIGGYARVVEYEIVMDTLDLTQTAVGEVAKATTNTLEITQVLTFTIIRNLAVVHTLTIHSGGVGILYDEEFYSTDLPTLTGPNAPEVP